MRLGTQPKMSTHGDENTGEAKAGIIEGSEENSVRFSPELLDERIKASLEPLHAQISDLTEMMDRLIQSNLTTESTTASSWGPGLQYESPYGEGPGSSKFPTVAHLTTAGYSPDSMKFNLNTHLETYSEKKEKVLCPFFFYDEKQNFHPKRDFEYNWKKNLKKPKGFSLNFLHYNVGGGCKSCPRGYLKCKIIQKNSWICEETFQIIII